RRIVEIHGALDESQSEDAGVEIEIALWVAGDAGDVVNAGGSKTHRAGRAGLAPFLRLAPIGAGPRRGALASVSALVLSWVGRDIFGIRLSGTRAGIAIALS